VTGEVTEAALDRLRHGVILDGSHTAPADFERIEEHPDGTWLRVVLREGRNRQIRRMLAQVGLEVARLVRVRVGPLSLGDLPVGAWKRLSTAQVTALRGA
jgi:pseudouridine synthase